MRPPADLNVVLVTYNWPPRNAIGAHRPYSWAKYWSRQGAKIWVLTTKKYPFDAPLDLDLPPLPEVEVIEIAYLPTAGRTGLLQSEKLKAWVRRLLPAGISGGVRGRWRKAAAQICGELAAGADVVVSTLGPSVCHLIGYDMKTANPNLIWIADYRDLWSENPELHENPSQRGAARELERSTVGAKADALMTVSAEMAAKLQALHGKHVLVLPNGFDTPAETVARNLERGPGSRNGPKRIVHTGLVYPGLRDPEPLLRAAAELRAEGRIGPGDLTVDFYGSRIAVAERLAEDPKYRPFVRIMGHVPRQQALEAQLGASRLLLLESPEPRHRGALTGKIFEYMAAGIPILSVGSPQGTAIWNLLQESGTGLCCGTELDAMKHGLLEMLEEDRPPAWFQPNVELILSYSRERQAERALEFIRDQIG